MPAISPGRLALWWVLGLGCLGAMLVVATGSPRLGGNLLAAVIALAGLLRAGAPLSLAGGLAIRSRVLDVLMYTALAVVVFVGTNAVNWHPPR